MSAAPFARVRQLFEEALELEPDAWDAFLAEACAGDQELRAEVESLLASDRRTRGLTRVVEGEQVLGIVAQSSGAISEGAIIGDFRLLHSLASGGMGTVFVADQESPKRRVALKLMDARFSSPAARRRFEYESEVLARMNHPSVAQVYASGIHVLEGSGMRRELPWIAMELVEDARSITEHVREVRASLAQCLELFGEVCAAVQYGHVNGIIHRDLKPANILVGREGLVKVIDFGIARATEVDAGRTELTETGQVIGTLRYMSPEQLGAGAVDARTDVYSLGLLLYELLSGEPAFDFTGRSFPEVAVARSKADPPSLVKRVPELPRELDWITGRALAREPDARYATVAELADDLRRFGLHEPVHAGPPGTAYHVAKFVRRNRLGVLSAAAIVVALVTATVVSSVSLASARAENAKRMLLSDAGVLRRANERERDLWPAYEESIEALDAWLADAEGLHARLANHEEVLRELEGRGKRTLIAGTPQWEFEDANDANWHATVVALIESLNEFFDPDTGLVARIRERRSFAATIRHRSVDGPEAKRCWKLALESIADESQCPLYEGLRMQPQLGLLPLGRNPETGLWEFAHLQTGELAERDETGEFRIGAESGLVFVLIPGGVARLGIRPGDLPEDARRAIESQGGFPAPIEVAMSPFFLSKYEMTQGQWRRITDSTPSRVVSSGPDAPTHPVEMVSWLDCDQWMARLDLELPPEVEWEYATRGGTEGRNWAESEGLSVQDVEWVPGGDQTHKPVGSLAANPFGLFDTIGNVKEWCANRFEESARQAGSEVAARRESREAERIYRGSSSRMGLTLASSSLQLKAAPDLRQKDLGVRPLRTLVP